MLDATVALLLLTDDEWSQAPQEAWDRVSFGQSKVAKERLQGLCQNAMQREWFAQCLPSLMHALSEAADPDASLVNFEHFVNKAGDREVLYRYLAENPRAIEILVRLFVGSQFLTQILIRNPDYLQRLTKHKRLAEIKSREEFFEQGRLAIEGIEESAHRLDALRKHQQWELLRLAACDSFHLMDLKSVTLQLALLADALVQLCLREVNSESGFEADDFCVLAFGKLGGEELNYSSDIDLVFICQSHAERYWGLGQKLIKAIGDSTSEGFLYRVDMRLRPWGKSGALVTTCDAYVEYLKRHGRLWEKQALIKARPIAGNLRVGRELLGRLSPFIYDVDIDEARLGVLEMKQRIEQQLARQGKGWGEVKSGQGSIRDIEFITQFLQLKYARDDPGVRSINTLDALVRLVDFDHIHADEYRYLSSGYICLRTIEHALQLMNNQPEHSLPTSTRELDWLARRLDFPGAQEFVAHYEQHGRAIRRVYEKYIIRGDDGKTPVPAATHGLDSHLGAAIASYRELFSDEQAQRHLHLLDKLDRNEEALALVESRQLPDGKFELTIVGYDHIGDLSIMCGLLSVYGTNIEGGNVFTGGKLRESLGHETGDITRRGTPATYRKYVNVLTLSATQDGAAPDFEKYETELRELLQLSREGKQEEVQGLLAKRFARAALIASKAPTPLLPVEIEIDNSSDPDATIMHIQGVDTVGFLYELTNALAMNGVSIQRMSIRSTGTQVIDTLWVTDEQGERLRDDAQLRELRSAVVLIKHFTHLLPHSPNPEAALLHFRDFLRQLFEQPDWVNQLASLQRTDVLDALARLLGVSDFLWEDFLKLQHGNLFPVVTDIDGLKLPKSRKQLLEELNRELAAAGDIEVRRSALNAFKDREMLRVDLRHILGMQDQFGMFSQELTDIAEVIVDAAYLLARQELDREYGAPQAGGRSTKLCICALGKCGGQELGFASDIELLFVYDHDGSTAGPHRITNIEYYQKLVEHFLRTISARRRGIFEIDLRLRPYGKAGSLVISLETFEKYFSSDGPAWPYERQSLVKLRPIAGDLDFGEEITQVRDQIIYTGAPFDVTSMRAMRERQIQQLVRPGTFNAKLSPGGLVDCEYLVQGLQITYGHTSPAVRQTNTREALKALVELGIITEQQRLQIRDGYRFLRRLIDALRMVRGDARDLTVPAADTEEFEFLARRLGYQEPAGLSRDLHFHTARIQEYCRNQLDRVPMDAPGHHRET